MVASTVYASSLQPSMNGRRSPVSTKAVRLSGHHLTSVAKPYLKEIQQQLKCKIGEASDAVYSAAQRMLDAFVNITFTFSAQPLRPSEGNFAPVEEIGEIAQILEIEGEIPTDFPEGVYIRNGSNPLFGALHDASSIFGKSGDIWAEGEGMLHSLYFSKSSSGDDDDTWSVSYTNRYVQSDTFRAEKARRRPCFLPVTKGDPLAMLAAIILNMLRFGKVLRDMGNTSVFEHAGRVYASAESDLPHEIDLHGLGTLGSWDVGGEWNMPFTAHPKIAPGTGELVISGLNVVKPFLTVGVVSEDGKKLKRKVDVKLERCAFCHEIGVTRMYNIIMDMPLTLSPSRIMRGAPLIEYEKEGYAKIGVMPRYGDAKSILWFNVEPFCTVHLVNCFEDADEVVVRGFRVPGSIITGPTLEPTTDEESANQGLNEEYFSRLYEWRLNLKSKAIIGKYLTGIDVAMEFPFMNDKFVGLHNGYAYAQVIDAQGSLAGGCGIVRPKFGGFAKLYLDEKKKLSNEENQIHVEYHHLDQNQFCSGATFVPKVNGIHEDDGWIISFVHDEGTNISQAHIIDTQRFESEPIAKITLPRRVPYGFHGAFISKNM